MSGPGAVRGRRGALLAALPLTALALAAPAAAAPTGPANGERFDAHTTVRITASYGGSLEERRLTLAAPGQEPVLVDRADAGADSGTLTHVLDTACWTADCTPAPNGTWTVSQTGGGSGTSTFTTRIPPAPPAALEAAPVSTREVRLTWTRGSEPDLVGFTVLEGDAVVQDGLTTQACTGRTCSTVVRYASEGTGAHTYSVRSRRSTAPGSGETLSSAASEPATTRLDPPPSPDPSPGDPPSEGGSGEGAGGGPSSGDGPGTGTGDGGTGGAGTGGGTSPGAPPGDAPGGTPGSSGAGGVNGPRTGSGPSAAQTAAASRRAFASGFSDFGPKLGIPKLPPLPQAPPPEVAPEVEDGDFEGTLGFEDQVLREQVDVAQGPGERVVDVVGSALDSERLATSTAGALVLLLAGAHLRRWLGVAAED